MAEEPNISTLPGEWSWYYNTEGGHVFTVPVDGVCVRTRTDYALNGFDLEDLRREVTAEYRDHLPGFRDARWSLRQVFAGQHGATLTFRWFPRNDEREYLGITDIAVVDGDVYLAEARWPMGAPKHVVAEAVEILDGLHIGRSRPDFPASSVPSTRA